MGEHFYGKSFSVHFSNGATEDLFRIFIELSEIHPTVASKKTAAFLQECLNRGYGWRAFSIRDGEAEDDVLIEIARIIQLFCNETSKDNTTFKSSDIVWDRELKLSWLGRAVNLHFLIAEFLQEKGITVSPLNIVLPPADAITFERLRLLTIYWDRKEREDFTKSERRETWQKIVALSEKEGERLNEDQLISVYYEYVSFLDEDIDRAELIKTWKKILELEKKIRNAEGITLAEEILTRF